jgi:hypothetical protein
MAGTGAPAGGGMLALARWVSIVGHPFVLLPAAILAAGARRLSAAQTASILVVVGLVLAAMAAYVRREVRRGQLDHIDVTVRQQRAPTYRLAIVLTAVTFVVLRATGPAGGGALGALVVLVSSALLNRVLKVSLHTGFAIYAAALIWLAGPIWFAVFVVMAGAVAWSRVALGRHTWAEILVGLLTGTAGGIVAHVV